MMTRSAPATLSCVLLMALVAAGCQSSGRVTANPNRIANLDQLELHLAASLKDAWGEQGLERIEVLSFGSTVGRHSAGGDPERRFIDYRSYWCDRSEAVSRVMLYRFADRYYLGNAVHPENDEVVPVMFAFE